MNKSERMELMAVGCVLMEIWSRAGGSLLLIWQEQQHEH